MYTMTTVRLEPKTKKKLEVLKHEFNARSYDDLFEKMIVNVRKKISMFGADPELGGWKEGDREHHDRH